jgi:hypothetical protein
MVDFNESKSGMLQSKWSPTKWITWTVTGMVGDETPKSTAISDLPYHDFKNNTTYLVNTVLTFKPWEKWEFAAEGTYGQLDDLSNDGSHYQDDQVRDARWWGAAGYMKYKFLKGWYLAARGEYFNDDGATRTMYGWRYGAAETENHGGNIELYSGTATMSYSPVSPFEIRLEYRYDAASEDDFISKNYVPIGHTGDGNARSRVNTQDTLTVQFLYKF